MNALLGAMESEKTNNSEIILSKNENDIENNLKDSKDRINILAISFFTQQKEEIKKLIFNLKEKYNNKLLIIGGGPHASAKPEESVSFGFDYIIKGEGEKLFPELINKLSYKNFPDQKILFSNEKINLNDYLSFSKKYLKFGPIEITRGCPYACKFCQTSFLFGCQPRHRDIPKIIEQVKEMAKIGLDDIRFITPNAMSYGSNDGKNIDLKIVEEMLKSVKKNLNPNGRIFFGTFPSEIRPEHINEDSLNLIKKYCANKQLTIGVQSASNRILEKINRGHNIETAKNAIKLCLKNNFKPIIDLIFGLPEEEQEDIEETIEFIDEFSKLGAIIHTHTFMPLPGTPFYNKRIGEIPKKLKLKIKHLENKKIAFGKWERDLPN